MQKPRHKNRHSELYEYSIVTLQNATTIIMPAKAYSVTSHPDIDNRQLFCLEKANMNWVNQ